jgi:hypothetical protein
VQEPGGGIDAASLGDSVKDGEVAEIHVPKNDNPEAIHARLAWVNGVGDHRAFIVRDRSSIGRLREIWDRASSGSGTKP